MKKPETGMHTERDTPTMSVILPVHNAGKFLDAAIESVLRQSHADFELLLLNDGSSDSSLKRLEYYAARDARCKVHSWPNRGVPQTLNEGIRLARADILVRMDADDICHPLRFEKQLKYLNAHPECAAVGTQVMLIDPEGWPIRPFVEATRHSSIDAEHLAGRGGAIAHPSVAMRKSAVASIGGYRTEFTRAQDIDLFLRLAEVGQLANLPEVLLDYRQRLH
jgi:glycosyltransferase involved in cell wall biosynthesis